MQVPMGDDPWTPKPTDQGMHRYREPGWKRALLVDVCSDGVAIFTNEDGANETEVDIANLPGEWSGPLDT